MKGAQAASVLAQALRDGEQQFAGTVAQRAHQERRVAQVPCVRLVRHLIRAQHSGKHMSVLGCQRS